MWVFVDFKMILYHVKDVRILFFLENCKNSNVRKNIEKFLSYLDFEIIILKIKVFPLQRSSKFGTILLNVGYYVYIFRKNFLRSMF